MSAHLSRSKTIRMAAPGWVSAARSPPGQGLHRNHQEGARSGSRWVGDPRKLKLGLNGTAGNRQGLPDGLTVRGS